MTVDRPEDRAILFKHGVLAFQHMKAKKNLDELDRITGENVVELGRIFSTQDDLEATSYYQIVKGRIKVIQALADKVDDDALEKTIQKHLFEHLWLLDPSWERATGTPYMEQRVVSEFDSINAKLPQEVRSGRVDIKYRTSSGKHVIIELKRSSVFPSHGASARSMKSCYISAIERWPRLPNRGKGDEPIVDMAALGWANLSVQADCGDKQTGDGNDSRDIDADNPFDEVEFGGGDRDIDIRLCRELVFDQIGLNANDRCCLGLGHAGFDEPLYCRVRIENESGCRCHINNIGLSPYRWEEAKPAINERNPIIAPVIAFA